MSQCLNLDFPVIKRDLLRSRRDCALRGLRQSAKWASELAYVLRDVEASPPDQAASDHDDDLDDSYFLAKSYLDLQEYDRVAYFTKNASGTTRFLHFYARYLSDEKKRLDDTVEPITATDRGASQELKDLQVCTRFSSLRRANLPHSCQRRLRLLVRCTGVRLCTDDRCWCIMVYLALLLVGCSSCVSVRLIRRMTNCVLMLC